MFEDPSIIVTGENCSSDVEVDDNITSTETATPSTVNTRSPGRNIATTPKKRPRKRRSPVWAEYLVIDKSITKDGKERATCFHCKTATFISDSHYGTKNLIEHLKKCIPYKESLTKDGTTRVFDQVVYRDMVARAIIKHGYAFSWVEHSENRNIHTYLNNQVRTITRNTAKADCLKLHKSLKLKLLNIFKKVPGRICLTSDMWTSCQTEGYLCLTAHYVDSCWTLKSKVLNFRHIETPHTGYEMYSAVSGLLKSWGIEDKIFTITLDNASSNDKMQDYLKDSLNARGLLLNKGRFLHVRCAAHVLNLIVQDGLLRIQKTVRNIRNSVKYIKYSEVRKKTFKSCVTLAAITHTKALWLDVPTRWNSTYMMLDRAIIYRDAFKELKNKDRSYKYYPSSSEWGKLEKVRDILEPFCDITNLFSGSEYPTSNFYFENVWRIAMHLRELASCEDDDLRAMGDSMQDKFDKYWLHSDDDDYNTLFVFAVILDPRHKKQLLKHFYRNIFEDNDKASLEVDEVLCKLKRLLDEYAAKRTNIPSQNSDVYTTARLSSSRSSSSKRKFDLLDFDIEESTCDTSQRSELDLYLDDKKLDRNVDLNILHFWKEHENKYVDLACLARDILSVPLTTVASESTFSIGGRVLNKWRSCYLPDNIEALITSRSWLHGYDPGDEEDFLGSDVEWNVST